MDFCSQLCVNLIIDGLKNDKTNLVLSPMSYNIILNMIAGGATRSTLKELLEFLQCPEITAVNSNSEKMMGLTSDGGDDEGGSVMQCLNGIWYDRHYRLKDSYQKLARKIYKAHIKSGDFENKANEVVKDANAWAKTSTKGLVTKILSRGDLDDATLVLGNCLYFKGFWEKGFNPDYPEDKHFYLMNGRRKSVPFMTNRRTYSVRLLDGFEVLKIPYQSGDEGNTFSMYIFLPEKEFGLENLLHKAASEGAFLRQNFKLHEKRSYEANIWIPKFKFCYITCEGLETMQKMGLKSPFDRNSSEFKKMVNGGLSVSKIVQKSFIEVDEEGTEAVAVTYRVKAARRVGAMSRPKKFIVDRPFMFMIREKKSKFVIFTGVVLDPTGR